MQRVHSKEKIAIVAQDHGGVNQLLDYIIKKKLNKKFKCCYFLSGQAINIFKSKKLITKKYKTNYIWNKSIKKIFYSLSWKKKIENFALKNASRYNINSTLCIDGWCNYKKKMKFKKNKSFYFPSKIIVFDKIAYKICLSLKLQKKSKLMLHKNLNLQNKYKKLKRKIGKSKNKKILYLSSPIKKLDSKNFNFLKNFAKGKKMQLKIRPHPSQKNLTNNNKKYNKDAIFNELVSSKYVIGHCSTALVHSALLGIKTVSIQRNVNSDLFQWKKFSIYKTFNIFNLNSFKDLKSI